MLNFIKVMQTNFILPHSSALSWAGRLVSSSITWTNYVGQFLYFPVECIQHLTAHNLLLSVGYRQLSPYNPMRTALFYMAILLLGIGSLRHIVRKARYYASILTNGNASPILHRTLNKLQVPKLKVDKRNGHPIGAARRRAANLMVEELASKCDLTTYSIAKSNTDHGLGSRILYNRKDLSTYKKMSDDPIPPNVLFKMTDVDHFVPKGEIANYVEQGPVIMYGWETSAAGFKQDETSVTYEGDEWVFHTPGSDTFRHQLWNYNSEEIGITQLKYKLTRFTLFCALALLVNYLRPMQDHLFGSYCWGEQSYHASLAWWNASIKWMLPDVTYQGFTYAIPAPSWAAEFTYTIPWVEKCRVDWTRIGIATALICAAAFDFVKLTQIHMSVRRKTVAHGGEDRTRCLVLLTKTASTSTIGTLLNYLLMGSLPELSRFKPTRHKTELGNVLSIRSTAKDRSLNLSIEGMAVSYSIAPDVESQFKAYYIRNGKPPQAAALILSMSSNDAITANPRGSMITTTALNALTVYVTSRQESVEINLAHLPHRPTMLEDVPTAHYTVNPDEQQQSECRDSMQSIYPQIVKGLCATRSGSNERNSLKTRLVELATTAEGTKRKETKLDGKYLGFVEEFIKFAIPDSEVGRGIIDDVQSLMDRQVKPGQVRMNKEALTQADFTRPPVERKANRTFLKAEVYDGENIKDPRTITPSAGDVRFITSLIYQSFKPLTKAWKWYAFGTGPRETASRVADHMHGKKTACETDLHRMDGTVSKAIRQLDEAMLKRHYGKNLYGTIKVWIQLLCNNITKGKFGNQCDQGTAQASGAADTSLANTWRTAFLFYCALRLMGHIPVKAWGSLGIFGGDDGIQGDISAEKVKEAATALNFEIECEEKPRGQPITFLSRWYSPDVWFGQPANICSARRTLRQLTKTGQTTIPKAFLRTQRVQSYRTSDNETPFIGQFLHTLDLENEKNHPEAKKIPSKYRFNRWYDRWRLENGELGWQSSKDNYHWAEELVVKELGIDLCNQLLDFSKDPSRPWPVEQSSQLVSSKKNSVLIKTESGEDILVVTKPTRGVKCVGKRLTKLPNNHVVVIGATISDRAIINKTRHQSSGITFTGKVETLQTVSVPKPPGIEKYKCLVIRCAQLSSEQVLAATKRGRKYHTMILYGANCEKADDYWSRIKGSNVRDGYTEWKHSVRPPG